MTANDSNPERIPRSRWRCQICNDPKEDFVADAYCEPCKVVVKRIMQDDKLFRARLGLQPGVAADRAVRIATYQVRASLGLPMFKQPSPAAVEAARANVIVRRMLEAMTPGVSRRRRGGAA